MRQRAHLWHCYACESAGALLRRLRQPCQLSALLNFIACVLSYASDWRPMVCHNYVTFWYSYVASWVLVVINCAAL